MATIEKKSFDKPDETRPITKGKIEVVNLGGVQAMRVRFEPGWRWSECVKSIVDTDSCKVAHFICVTSGRMVTRMDDGTQIELGPGEVASIPPGHDAWIVGNEPFAGIDFQGAGSYAKPQS
jgi:hypothetical protein